ncbi:hypothetical protein HDU67_006484 [Dinochytrium kinnereticum]|nr:hypothetical protein HDU67_006484 [Dinochytrium kinnereticum]
MGKYTRQPILHPTNPTPLPTSPDGSLWIEFPIATSDSTYLQLNVSQPLIQGLTHLLLTNPKDPIDALGRYLVETDRRRVEAEAMARRLRDEAIARMPTVKEVRDMKGRFQRSVWEEGEEGEGRRVVGDAGRGYEEEGDGVPYAFGGGGGRGNRDAVFKGMTPAPSTTPPFSPPAVVKGREREEGGVAVDVSDHGDDETRGDVMILPADVAVHDPLPPPPPPRSSERSTPPPKDDSIHLKTSTLPPPTTAPSRSTTPSLAMINTDAIDVTLAPEEVRVGDHGVDERILEMVGEGGGGGGLDGDQRFDLEYEGSAQASGSVEELVQGFEVGGMGEFEVPGGGVEMEVKAEASEEVGEGKA